jgi:DNA-directed RNA polymerase subunit RPC12/RpoP
MPLVAAKCPQCGGDLQLDNEKELGFCMYCGSKIVVQEAIRAIRIDYSFMIEKWMKTGDLAAEGGNLSEAYDYYTKIVEAQPDNWLSIFKKGKVAGWQSTLANMRLTEATTCFGEAINLAPDEEKEDLKNESAEEVKKLALAIISLRADRFMNWPDEDEANGFSNDIKQILNAVFKLNDKSGFIVSGFMEPIATKIISSVIETWNRKILPEYNGQENHPGNFEFNQFIERIGYCTTLVENAINLSDKDYKEDIRGFKTLITLEEVAIKSCSWDYEITNFGGYWTKDRLLTDAAQQIRRNYISMYKTKISQIETKMQKHLEAELQEKEKKAKEESQKKFDEYWCAHKNEKLQLEEERNALSSRIISFENERKAVTKELLNENNNIKAQIEKISGEQKSLGLFKGKEKKALQAQINCAQIDLDMNNSKVNELQKPIIVKINDLKKRITEIDIELSKKR